MSKSWMVMYMFIETEMGQQQISTHTEDGGFNAPPTPLPVES